MAGVNKAILVGNLGRDPEIRYSQDGVAMVNFSIATSENWKDKVTGEKREKTEWHRIVAFGRLGEICGEYLSKGRKVYIEGRIQTRDWEDKEGVKRYITEILASSMQMLDSKADAPPRESSEPPSFEQSRPDSHVRESFEDDGYSAPGPIPSADAEGPQEDDIPF